MVELICPSPTALCDSLGRSKRCVARRDVQMGADRDVLAHGEPGERLHDLERARDAAPRQLDAAARR